MSRRPIPRGADLLLVFAAAVAVHALAAAHAAFPPDNDPIYYWDVARNVANGDGLVSRVTWQFLHLPSSAMHPAGDYWMPLWPLLVAPFAALSGAASGWALLPSVLASAMAVTLGAAVVGRFVEDRVFALATGLALVAVPATGILQYGGSCDAVPPYVAAMLGALLLHERASRAPRDARHEAALGLAFGVLVAACQLVRADGGAVLVAATCAVALLSHPLRLPHPPARFYAWALPPLALAVGAWSLYCRRAFGTAWSPASGQAPWLLDYTDVFEYPSVTSPSRYLATLREDAGPMLAEKAMAVVHELTRPADRFGLLLALLAVPGLILALRRRQALAWLFVTAFVAISFLYGLVMTAFDAGGGAYRSAAAFDPLLLGSLALGVEALLLRATPARCRAMARRLAGILALTASAVLVIAGGMRASRPPEALVTRRMFFEALRQSVLPLAGLGADEPILSNAPFIAAYGTGHPVVMVPVNGPEASCTVAARFGARHALLLDEAYLGHPRMRWLRDVVEGADLPPHEAIARGTGWVLLRLRCEGASAPASPAP